MKKRVIDRRVKEKFMLDDEYLNGQAKLCGWQGTLVYMSLCRHADKEQEAFPAIKTMAEQHNVSRNTILKGIKNLEERNLIQVGKKRTKSGQWLNNTYILIDKSEWNYSQVPEKDTASQVPVVTTPSPSGELDQVPHKDTKETHSEGNTYKETHTLAKQSFADTEHLKVNEIQKILDLFYKVNPTLNFANKTLRRAAEDLIAKFGFEKTLHTVEYATSIQGKRYAPVITTPLELKNNMGKLLAYYKREQEPVKGSMPIFKF